jgi:hypothetical protein
MQKWALDKKLAEILAIFEFEFGVEGQSYKELKALADKLKTDEVVDKKATTVASPTVEETTPATQEETVVEVATEEAQEETTVRRRRK